MIKGLCCTASTCQLPRGSGARESLPTGPIAFTHRMSSAALWTGKGPGGAEGGAGLFCVPRAMIGRTVVCTVEERLLSGNVIVIST